MQSMIKELRFLLLWQTLFVTLSCAAVLLQESGSTTELYKELLSTSKYSFVYIYSPVCQWCAELTPIFTQLSGLFVGSISFIMIDGRKARNLNKDFNVMSYPYLLLFEGVENVADVHEGSPVSPKDLLKGIYYGAKEVSDMAYYLTQLTGEIPNWPRYLGDKIRNLEDSGSIEKFCAKLTSPEAETPVSVISFTSPWMDFHYQDMFQAYKPASLLARNLRFFNDSLQIFTVDGSQSSTSSITNLFRIVHFPSLVVQLPHCGKLSSTIVIIEFHKYDSQILEKEVEVVRRVIELCMADDQTGLTDYINKFHSIQIYRSLTERQQKKYEAAVKIDVSDDETNMKTLFKTIRDI